MRRCVWLEVLNISSVAGHSMGRSAQCLITHVVRGKRSKQEMTAERRSLQTQRRKRAFNKNRPKLQAGPNGLWVMDQGERGMHTDLQEGNWASFGQSEGDRNFIFLKKRKLTKTQKIFDMN